MDEERSVSTPSTPSTTSVSTPPSPPMRGTKVRPLNGNTHSNNQGRSRPSVFQGDGLEAFVQMFGSGDGGRSSDTLDPVLPPSPMERYQHWKGEDPWQPPKTMGGQAMGGQAMGEYSEEGEGSERERRLSSVFEETHNVFGSTEEAQNQALNKTSSATIETRVNEAKETVPMDRPQKSHLRELMARSQAERQKKISRRGVYAPPRQRKNTKKDDGTSVVVETGAAVGPGRDERGKKRIGSEISVVSDRGEYDSSLRSRSFSVSDEEEKSMAMSIANIVER